MPPKKRRDALSPSVVDKAVVSAQSMRTAFRVVQSSHNNRKLGKRGRPAKSAADTVTLKLNVITLVEVWASRRSAFAEAVRRLGGASLRISWPPPPTKRGNALGKKRNVRGQQLTKEEPAPPQPPPLQRGCARIWYLNLELRSHQQVLEDFVYRIQPVSETNGVHIHTSPMCYPFSHPQHLSLARGVDNSHEHAAGVRRLCFARRLHRVHKSRSLTETGSRTASHEQPERSSVDFTRRPYIAQRDFPWALGACETRSVVRGCAAGLTSIVNGKKLAIKKAWVFESDSSPLHMALSPFRWCSGDHVHAQTIPSKPEVGQPQSARTSTKGNENYPFFLGCALGVGVCYEPATARQAIEH